ncbi:MAG: cell division protein ZapA, partial [Brevundimonas diminuta]
AATAAVATPAPASDGVAEALNAVAARIEKIVQTM